MSNQTKLPKVREKSTEANAEPVLENMVQVESLPPMPEVNLLESMSSNNFSPPMVHNEEVKQSNPTYVENNTMIPVYVTHSPTFTGENSRLPPLSNASFPSLMNFYPPVNINESKITSSSKKRRRQDEDLHQSNFLPSPTISKGKSKKGKSRSRSQDDNLKYSSVNKKVFDNSPYSKISPSRNVLQNAEDLDEDYHRFVAGLFQNQGMMSNSLLNSVDDDDEVSYQLSNDDEEEDEDLDVALDQSACMCQSTISILVDPEAQRAASPLLNDLVENKDIDQDSIYNDLEAELGSLLEEDLLAAITNLQPNTSPTAANTSSSQTSQEGRKNKPSLEPQPSQAQLRSLRHLISQHYQLLLQQSIMAVRTAYCQKVHRENKSSPEIYVDLIGNESSDDLTEIIDGSVGMLQDLFENRNDAIRRNLYKSEENKAHLTRSAFRSTLQGEDKISNYTTFDIKGIKNLQATLTLIDSCVDKRQDVFLLSDRKILEAKQHNEACTYVLENSNAELDTSILPSRSNFSNLFTYPIELMGDDSYLYQKIFPLSCSDTVIPRSIVPRNRNQFTAGEDNLILRGINLYGEKEWLLISDRFLPDRSVSVISQRYSRLCYLIYKANGVEIDQNGNLPPPPVIEDGKYNKEALEKINIVKSPLTIGIHRWSLEEDLALLKAVPILGNNWAVIRSTLIAHRDRGHLRKRHQVLERRIKSTLKRERKEKHETFDHLNGSNFKTNCSKKLKQIQGSRLTPVFVNSPPKNKKPIEKKKGKEILSKPKKELLSHSPSKEKQNVSTANYKRKELIQKETEESLETNERQWNEQYREAMEIENCAKKVLEVKSQSLQMANQDKKNHDEKKDSKISKMNGISNEIEVKENYASPKIETSLINTTNEIFPFEKMVIKNSTIKEEEKMHMKQVPAVEASSYTNEALICNEEMSTTMTGFSNRNTNSTLASMNNSLSRKSSALPTNMPSDVKPDLDTTPIKKTTQSLLGKVFARRSPCSSSKASSNASKFSSQKRILSPKILTDSMYNTPPNTNNDDSRIGFEKLLKENPDSTFSQLGELIKNEQANNDIVSNGMDQSSLSGSKQSICSRTGVATRSSKRIIDKILEKNRENPTELISKSLLKADTTQETERYPSLSLSNFPPSSHQAKFLSGLSFPEKQNDVAVEIQEVVGLSETNISMDPINKMDISINILDQQEQKGFDITSKSKKTADTVSKTFDTPKEQLSDVSNLVAHDFEAISALNSLSSKSSSTPKKSMHKTSLFAKAVGSIREKKAIAAAAKNKQNE